MSTMPLLNCLKMANIFSCACYCIVDDIFSEKLHFLGGNKSSKLFVIDVVVPVGCG